MNFKLRIFIAAIISILLVILWTFGEKLNHSFAVKSQENNEKQCPIPLKAKELSRENYGKPPTQLKYSWESEISEADLLKPSNGIPKIIHQSWKTTNLVGNFKHWSQQWKEVHPNFTYLLWTDDDNRLFVYKNYPWFLVAYDMMPRKIFKIDIVRCLYLHKYGGLYADLDMLPAKPNDVLLELKGSQKIVLGQISDDFAWEHNIPNAWMASVPGHDFWLMNVNLATQRSYVFCENAELTTGPVLLKDTVHIWNRMNRKDELKLIEPGLVYGVDWRKSTKRECWDFGGDKRKFETCITKFYPNVYAFTAWTHSWE